MAGGKVLVGLFASGVRRPAPSSAGGPSRSDHCSRGLRAVSGDRARTSGARLRIGSSGWRRRDESNRRPTLIVGGNQAACCLRIGMCRWPVGRGCRRNRRHWADKPATTLPLRLRRGAWRRLDVFPARKSPAAMNWHVEFASAYSPPRVTGPVAGSSGHIKARGRIRPNRLECVRIF